MTRFVITIMRDDDLKQGLESIRDIIVNGLSCAVPDSSALKIEYMDNAIDISWEQDPETLESSFSFEEPEDDIG